MDQEINYIEIEKKWQQNWAEANAHTPNFDNLDEFADSFETFVDAAIE